MGVNKKTHNNIRSFGQALKKGIQARKWRQEKMFRGFKHPQCSMLLCQALGGKNTFGVENRKKVQIQTYFFF